MATKIRSVFFGLKCLWQYGCIYDIFVNYIYDFYGFCRIDKGFHRYGRKKTEEIVYMELLFYWTTGTNPSTISSPQGFNLSPEYDFHIGREKEKYFLYEDKNWDGHLSVFKNENIVNLTMLVGENGVGKTTILRSILSHAEQMHDDYNNGLKDYSVGAYPNKHFKGLGDPIMFVVIGLIEGELNVYHSLPVLDYSRIQKMNPKVHAIGGRKRNDLYSLNEFPFQDTTIIYMTNSIYGSIVRERSYYKGVHSVGLTPKTLEYLSREFYDALYGLKEVYPYDRMGDSYLEWKWMLRGNKENLFQDFLNVMFYHRLLSGERYSNMKGKEPIDFSIYLRNAPGVFLKHIKRINDPNILSNEAIMRLFIVFSEAVTGWNAFLPKCELFTRVLYMNLVCEIIIECNKKGIGAIYENSLLKAFKYAVQNISENRLTVIVSQDGRIFIQENDNMEMQMTDGYGCVVWPFSDGVDKSDSVDEWVRTRISEFSDDDIFSDYITMALKEISEILAVTKTSRERHKKMWDANFEEYDLSDTTILQDLNDNNFSMTFRYDWKRIPKELRGNDENEYKDLIKTIVGFAEHSNSFVLRYLDVKTYGMSSGERSFLNFFSWLSEVPTITEKMNVNYYHAGKTDESDRDDHGLKKDVLFLFDEPDLYMHPQWQKNLISNLLEELRYQYKGKRVQVIMTTSSPLTLSDVPVENTVYLRREGDGGVVIEDRRQGQARQTFGADIYKLFADSFFLKGSPMGQFAENYINSEILAPLNKMRQTIWIWESSKAVEDNRIVISEPDKEEYRERLEQLSWKIQMLANTALFKKARQMHDEIMEWCNL